MEMAIRAEGLSKRFGDVHALDGLDLEAKAAGQAVFLSSHILSGVEALCEVPTPRAYPLGGLAPDIAGGSR